MKKILYSIYTDKYPNPNNGGPNNIIYKIISESSVNKYKFDYLSSDLFVSDLRKDKLSTVKNNRSLKKKIASYLGENSQFYKNIFSNRFYLSYHFYKKNKYYSSYKRKSSEYKIIHSQDSISLSLINNNNINTLKIFTVHSKGPLSDELKNLAKSESLSVRISKKLKILERKSIDCADIITFPSKAAREYFENSLKLKLNDDKVRIIHNGIDYELIQNIKSDENILKKYSISKENYDLILLNIAAHEQEKNIDILLKVVQKLKKTYKKEVLLINIGWGSLTNKLNKVTDNLNIKQNVRYLGKLPNEEVIKLLKVSDIFIMTSEKVIFDLVVLEALACGACAIVSNEGGNREIIKDNVNGYLINIDNIEIIAQKIIAINPNAVKKEALKTAQQFSVKKMVNEYFNIYDRVN